MENLDFTYLDLSKRFCGNSSIHLPINDKLVITKTEEIMIRNPKNNDAFCSSNILKDFDESSNLSEETIDTSTEDNFQIENSIKALVEKIMNHKREGAILAKDKKYVEAIKLFHISIDLLSNIENKMFQLIDYSAMISNKIECLLNISICMINMKSYDNAITYSDKILSLQKNNVRALYIKAKALKNLDKLSEAYDNIENALSIKTNKCLLKELKDLKQKLLLEENKYNTLGKNESKKSIIHLAKSNVIFKLLLIITKRFLETIKKNKLLFTIISTFLLYKIKNHNILLKFISIIRKIL